jgi:signal transduction histidine kinase
MSHELRTPLNGVIGFTELISDGKAGPLTGDQAEYLGDILSSARHLLSLIDDVLDMARVEAGRIDIVPSRVDVDHLVLEVCSLLRITAEQKSIHVAREIHPDVRHVYADPSKVKQVLFNYLSNALKFTGQHGAVWVRAVPHGDEEWRLEVEDTGPGIPELALPRLFKKFEQLSPVARAGYPGTGLGLALTKRIVEAHGGVVGVRSVVGKGSVFWAALPQGATPVGGGAAESLTAVR